jgi:hypothetical protein
MRNPKKQALALAAAGLALALAGPGQAETPGESPTITVHRGAQVSSVRDGVESPAAAGATPDGVSVVRGQGPAPAPKPETGQAAARQVPLLSAAGEVVWLLDTDDGRLIACELVETANLGASRIRCRSRDLPR